MLARLLRLCSFFLSMILLLHQVIDAQPKQHSATGQSHGLHSMDTVFDQLRRSPPELYAFLLRMPKGADLHNHLAGAVYAETYLKGAAVGALCIDSRTMSFVLPLAGTSSHCAEGQVEASSAEGNEQMASALIESLSMRDFVPATESAHDHFFATFAKFSAAQHGHDAELIAEVVRRAADQNESYLELMAFTAGEPVLALSKQLRSTSDLDSARKTLLDAGLQTKVDDLRRHVESVHAESRKALNCVDNPDSDPCRVGVRYIVQVLRNMPPEQVFAQVLACYMLAADDPLVVSVNLVQPEDGYYAMRDYKLHMQMIGYLRNLYPNVHLTLHAGELTSGLVPPDGLRFHIREALTLGHAERIGHGVDVMYETDPVSILRDMHDRSIPVEINLTSNDLILGVKDQNHPLPVYLKYGVPVTLATDDEGVSRSHLTEEYRRAVLQYGLTYGDVKQIVRNGIQFSFLPGQSYWQDNAYVQTAKPCRQSIKTHACTEFLQSSEKARAQQDLEDRFHRFESQELSQRNASR